MARSFSSGRSLKLKAIVFISLMILGVGSVLSWYFLTQSEAVLREQVRKRAQAQVMNLAHNSRYGLLTEDTVILDRLIDGVLQDENVLYAAIAGTDNQILVDRSGQGQLNAPKARTRAAAVAGATEPAIDYFPAGAQQISALSGVYHAVAPVLPERRTTSAAEDELAEALALLGGGPSEPVGEERLGSVQIIYSLERMEQTIAAAFGAGVGITLGTILIGILVSFFFVRYALTPVQAMAGAATRIAAGDLSQRVAEGSGDEIGLLAAAFNRMTEALSRVTQQTQRAVRQITASATQIADSGKSLETTVSSQATSTNQVSTTAREISATSQDLVNTMAGVARMAEDSVAAANAGRQGLDQMEESMRKMEASTAFIAEKFALINEKAASINSVVLAMTQVADQTNILSLNAAIEAEKAGDYGVGFAVVAREIRRLADQTAVATLDIEETVKEMLTAVASGGTSIGQFSEEIRTGSEVVRRVSAQVGGIIEQVNTLKPSFETVEDSMKGQSAGAQQISEAMVHINRTAQQTAESLRATNKALEQLTQAAYDLQEGTERFKAD